MVGTRLRTFAGGMEELTRALAERLGARLRLSAVVRRVARHGGEWRVTVEESGAVRELAAPSLILALPAHAAAPLLTSIDARAADAAAAIPYVPVTLAWAAWAERDLPRPLDRYGFLTAPGEPGALLGAVFASSAFADRAPQGMALVSARLGGARHPEVAELDDDELARLVHLELRPLLEARSEPSYFRPIRHRHALPQYTIGHGARLEALDAAEAAQPGLFFVGAGYRGAGVPDCVRAGARVAERVARFVSGFAARAARPESAPSPPA
jgi:oxygen-dependent protoporphyrinogen oxidase